MAQAEAFLTLAEELHFGRAAERLRVSQPRVSRLIAALERQAGGRLFERTSRKVTLTPLGRQLHAELRPGYEQMHAALDHARCTAREITGLLRLGILVTLASPALTRLIEEFGARCPGCELSLHTVEAKDPYRPLRRGGIDVLVSFLVVDEPDLTAGPAFEYRDRVLLAGRGHRLAGQESVSVEDLAGEEVNDNAPTFPAALFDAISPLVTPSGRPIRRTYPWTDTEDVLMAIARGRIVKPGMAGVPLTTRPDFVHIPIRDLPPMPVGLIWRTAHDNARIRALAARAIRQPPARQNRPTRPQPRHSPGLRE
jgi:DNA-binding transcriptional LysR family regulator